MAATMRAAVKKARIAAGVAAVATVAMIVLLSTGNLDVVQPAKPARLARPAQTQGTCLVREKISAVVCRLAFLFGGVLRLFLASGFVCYRDAANNPMCRDPNQATVTSTRPTVTSVVSEVSSVVEVTSTPAPEPSVTSVPPTTREEPTQPPVQSSPATVPQVTRTSLGSSAGGSTTRGAAATSTTTRSVETNAAFNSGGSSTNVGAIAGGTVAGVLAIALLALVIIKWHHMQAAKGTKTPAPATTESGPGPGHHLGYDQAAYNQPGYDQPAYNQPGADQPGYDEPGHDRPPYNRPPQNLPAYNQGDYGQAVYNSEPTPPTPGTGDPFLTPMTQHQGLGASYFVPGPASPGPSGTGSGTGTQYTGLPEPQPADYAGGAVVGAVSMPSPRRDGAQPRPLPMSVTSMQGGTNNSTRWSGYADSTPSSGLNATGYAGYPEVDSNNSQPRWSTPPAPNMVQPARAPSTVYQPSSHDGGYDEMYPPQSPPPMSAYGGMAPSVGGSGLPSGAAPPVTNFAPGEKHVYQPY